MRRARGFILFILYIFIFPVNIIYAGEERENGKSFTIVEEGKHGLIKFIVTIDPDGNIENLEVAESYEIRGKAIKKKRFLRQFIGKSSRDPIKLGKDIDAVTGATISSQAAAKAAKKALMMWKGLVMEEK